MASKRIQWEQMTLPDSRGAAALYNAALESTQQGLTGLAGTANKFAAEEQANRLAAAYQNLTGANTPEAIAALPTAADVGLTGQAALNYVNPIVQRAQALQDETRKNEQALTMYGDKAAIDDSYAKPTYNTVDLGTGRYSVNAAVPTDRVYQGPIPVAPTRGGGSGSNVNLQTKWMPNADGETETNYNFNPRTGEYDVTDFTRPIGSTGKSGSGSGKGTGDSSTVGGFEKTVLLGAEQGLSQIQSLRGELKDRNDLTGVWDNTVATANQYLPEGAEPIEGGLRNPSVIKADIQAIQKNQIPFLKDLFGPQISNSDVTTMLGYDGIDFNKQETFNYDALGRIEQRYKNVLQAAHLKGSPLTRYEGQQAAAGNFDWISNPQSNQVSNQATASAMSSKLPKGVTMKRSGKDSQGNVVILGSDGKTYRG